MAYKPKRPYKRRKNAKSEINKISDVLLGANKVLRDINALQKGTIVDRVERRLLGKASSKALGSDFLKMFRK